MMTESDQVFDAVGADSFCYNGHCFLILVDQFSGFPLVTKLKKTSTASIISKMYDRFLLYGFPSVIRTDGNPQFCSDSRNSAASMESR